MKSKMTLHLTLIKVNKLTNLTFIMKSKMTLHLTLIKVNNYAVAARTQQFTVYVVFSAGYLSHCKYFAFS